MGICSCELRQYVVIPTLSKLGICSVAAENLLLGTAAAQSDMGFHLNDTTHLGVYGIDSETHRKIWDEYLAFDSELASTIRGFASQHEFLKNPDFELATNLMYATAIAWMIYQRANIQLPHANDVTALARCWYEAFGQYAPNSSVDDFINHYHLVIGTTSKAA